MQSKHEYINKLKAKGWTPKDLAEYWGVRREAIYRMAANPSLKDWCALRGLRDYQEYCEVMGIETGRTDISG